MTTEYLVEIVHWDRTLHLLPSPGGIPQEHTFQGDLIYAGGLEFEGRVLSPPRHRRKRFRVWLSKLWPSVADDQPLGRVGSISERATATSGRELLVSLYAPESALEPATVCFGACWKYFRMTTSGRNRAGANITRFAFSRSRTDAQ
jgi:hypothetical protein